MQYEVIINIEVDDDSNMLEVGDTDNVDTISGAIRTALYDIDDINIQEIEVIRRLDWKLNTIN